MTGPGGFEPPDGVSLTGKPEPWPPERICRVCTTPILEGEGYDGEPDLCSRECWAWERQQQEWEEPRCYCPKCVREDR